MDQSRILVNLIVTNNHLGKRNYAYETFFLSQQKCIILVILANSYGFYFFANSKLKNLFILTTKLVKYFITIIEPIILYCLCTYYFINYNTIKYSNVAMV